MKKLEVLDLSFSAIGPAGIEALAEALRGGACANLEQLHFINEGVDGRALGFLVQAIAAGACPKLLNLKYGSKISAHHVEVFEGVLAAAGRGDVRLGY